MQTETFYFTSYTNQVNYKKQSVFRRIGETCERYETRETRETI